MSVPNILILFWLTTDSVRGLMSDGFIHQGETSQTQSGKEVNSVFSTYLTLILLHQNY